MGPQNADFPDGGGVPMSPGFEASVPYGGYLFVKKMLGWRKRYVHIYFDKLAYGSKKESKQKSYSYPETSKCIIRPIANPKGGKFGFRVDLPERKFALYAESEGERDLWMRCFRLVHFRLSTDEVKSDDEETGGDPTSGGNRTSNEGRPSLDGASSATPSSRRASARHAMPPESPPDPQTVVSFAPADGHQFREDALVPIPTGPALFRLAEAPVWESPSRSLPPDAAVQLDNITRASFLAACARDVRDNGEFLALASSLCDEFAGLSAPSAAECLELAALVTARNIPLTNRVLLLLLAKGVLPFLDAPPGSPCFSWAPVAALGLALQHSWPGAVEEGTVYAVSSAVLAMLRRAFGAAPASATAASQARAALRAAGMADSLGGSGEWEEDPPGAAEEEEEEEEEEPLAAAGHAPGAAAGPGASRRGSTAGAPRSRRTT
eukprot:tig00001388_g8588.t1